MAKQQMFVSSAKRSSGNGDGTLNLEIALSPPRLTASLQMEITPQFAMGLTPH